MDANAPHPARASCARAVFVLATTTLLFAWAGCGKGDGPKAGPEGGSATTATDPQKAGRIVVKTNRADATVEAKRLDAPGGAPAQGTAAQGLSGIPAGRYAVTLRSEGWPEAGAEVTVESGQAAEVTVNFKSGSLRLESEPTGATVKLGNNVLGKTPLTVPQLPAGECTLSLDLPGWPAYPHKVLIVENQEAAENVRIPHGRLVVGSRPAGATVVAGGKPIGVTPLVFERTPAGARKLTLQLKDFPPHELNLTVQDGANLEVSPILALGYPELDTAAFLRAVWWEPPRQDPERLSPSFDPFPGFRSQNGFVRNLNRKKLFEIWLGKRYRYAGRVKVFDRNTGQVEFVDQVSELSKCRVIAQLSPAARANPEVIAQLTAKNATFALYGRLAAVEEFERSNRPISIEFAGAELLPADPVEGK